ncbi:coiled-coil domain-containing protein [Streptomyces cinereoruber]|uniref:Chromosome segregation ATPase n=1 Tax=Streptomyces cinereoruber TaxID=67260 RepID=A0ABX6B7P5_9ACTN|nr:hypothetical protein [Streptomyces cinereoruber]MBB4161633.1 capsule polysaccharide export protein KpsE/RkpR [Streptomyces cinereoruber]MBY8820418.1 hypothetical protein [Streptomyces cinereoruber]NIH65514.1 capsule polysaccharide export protein KpsE/RkpR [Streptomyces cinereoruber]QEV30925.1 hypothetical protein CP977_00880 [Streptomyces cinereoruber]
MTAPPASDLPRGIVGDRQLVAVQTFDIARLTSHAVPIVPETFIAVSGLGPKEDSNGSGKTSFLIAVSLLLADPQWRLDTNGGRPASGILFHPDAAGVDQTHRASPVDHGYIVGVFAHPAHPSTDPLTVWIRIATTAPYLQANWTEGMHLADATTDHERSMQADDLWRALGTRRLLSARAMSDTLYGTAPRCLTYLDTALRPPAPSLLSQQLTEMEPHAIGRSLIALSGMSHLLDEEYRLRGQALEDQINLDKAQGEHDKQLLVEEQVMGAVRARQASRDSLEDGRTAWQRYLAASYREAYALDESIAADIRAAQEAAEAAEAAERKAADRVSTLRSATDLADKERQAKQNWSDAQQISRELTQKLTEFKTRCAVLLEERSTLLPQIHDWDGSDTTTTADRLQLSQRKHVKTEQAYEAAEAAVTRAEEYLHDVEQGRCGTAGRAIDLLSEHGIPAHGLLDQLDLDETARPFWEPRLAPWNDAVVIQPHHEDRARALLHTILPGTQIVICDPQRGPLPEGIRSSLNLTRFLTVLQERFAPTADGADVHDRALALTVTGGFTAPLAGRETRLQQARRQLAEAKTRATEAANALMATSAGVTLAQTQHTAAQAAEKLAQLKAEENRLQTDVDKVDARLVKAKRTEEQLQEVWEHAWGEQHGHEQGLATAKLELDVAKKELRDRRSTLTALERQRTKAAAPQWQNLWGATLDAAIRQLADIPDQAQAARPAALRRQAEYALRRAYEHYGVDGAPGADVGEDLREGERTTRSLAEADPGELPVRSFADAAFPLENRLAGHRDQDEVAAARITRDRQTRGQAIDELTEGAATRNNTLETLQDMIENHLESLLTQIGAAFNDLDLSSEGYGAKLEHHSVRPQGASDWHWQVTPRWKRSRNGGYVSYRENANSAQVKVHAIQLVLAALLADNQSRGRVLILDELGNSLGETNRKDVLAALRDVARDQHLTILGTCQDSVLADAADVCGELLWFTHASATDITNQPTSVWAFDSNGERTQLTEDWITAGRAHA